MSPKYKDGIVAIIMFVLIFCLWLYINIANYKLNTQNAINLSKIAEQLEIDLK